LTFLKAFIAFLAKLLASILSIDFVGLFVGQVQRIKKAPYRVGKALFSMKEI